MIFFDKKWNAVLTQPPHPYILSQSLLKTGGFLASMKIIKKFEHCKYFRKQFNPLANNKSGVKSKQVLESLNAFINIFVSI